ncbi:lipopolysaccharide heptosyltransferase I [Gammaproteobacteria bacterium]|nr:lipopolysaccharide heptosyltransferase I [Gammaproteobacteria bacterium]
MRVLIVKVSSLGDIIHTLPAVTDACRAKRNLRFDWVVEEGFTDIPSWHPAVDKVIPVAFRRWRKNLFKTWRSGEFRQFKKNLQEEHYDLVIDAQGLIKSGIISRISKGLTVGLSNQTIREPLAALFYNVVYRVPWQQHAVERVRDLFSRTFNYPLNYKSCDYGIDVDKFMGGQEQGKENTLVFLHGTTWDSKKWPDEYWVKLAQLAAGNGYKVKLLWGNQEELDRVKTISAVANNVEVLDRQSLTDIAKMLVRTKAVVAVDTGLAHLASALGVPVVSIYGASDPELTGTYGRGQLHLKPVLPCSPCLNKVCQYSGSDIVDDLGSGAFKVQPACFGNNKPELVWKEVVGLLEGGKGSLDNIVATD